MSECSICGNIDDFRFFVAREKMFGLDEPFRYSECKQCGTLQLMEVPEDLSKYYPANYYAFTSGSPVKFGLLRRLARKLKHSYCLYGRNPVGLALRIIGGYPGHFAWLRRAGVHFDSTILDVGCGAGSWLDQLANDGFENLTGVDPYIQNDQRRDNGVLILKRSLSEISGQFDFISMHHSFEHMADPRETLEHVHRLLYPGRYALIRIPIAPSFAWEKYGVNWVQLDAPRHIFIHSISGMNLLAESVGLKVSRIVFDSDHFQFTGSEKYLRGVPGGQPDETIFSAMEIAGYHHEAAKLNSSGRGDQAGFYLFKDAVITSS